MSHDAPSSENRTVDESNRLHKRALELVPGGAQTGSKMASYVVQGVSPTHLERADGSRVWDVDGNEYIDYRMALGPILLGYNYPDVKEAVDAQHEDGPVYSLEHPLHVEVADLLTETIPCAEMVQFGKNGNDVTTLAAKVARAYTGRDVIATQGYHGWPDVWMGKSGGAPGIPKAVGAYTESFEYGDIESLENVFEANPDDVAAVVMTPVGIEAPEDGYLEAVRELTEREDAVLVFDEVLSGFRYATGGAQAYFGVTPDLGCFAKGISNGYPLSALVGREDVMRTMDEDGFYFSMTYAGEALSLAAAKAAIEVNREEDVPAYVRRIGVELRDGYNELASDHGLDDLTECRGMGPRIATSFEDTEDDSGNVLQSLFMQECHRRGVLYFPGQLPSFSHTAEDVEVTLEVYDEALDEVATAVEGGDAEARLEGPPIGEAVTDSDR